MAFGENSVVRELTWQGRMRWACHDGGWSIHECEGTLFVNEFRAVVFSVYLNTNS